MSTELDRTPPPLVAAYARVRAIHPNWYVLEGAQRGEGWLDGEALSRPEQGTLRELLAAIARRLRTEDRKVAAGAFALRFGWAGAAAIGPFLVADCVPEFTPDNVSLRFTAETFFERVALRRLHGSALAGAYAPHPSVTLAADRDALRRLLREALLAQARPVMEALARWSGMNEPALWGLVTSSWGAQFAAVIDELGKPCEALPEIARFFAAGTSEFVLAPRFYPIDHAGVTRVYHRRSSCCLYHKTGGNYCASCPLIDDEERYRRNRVWTEQSLRRSART